MSNTLLKKDEIIAKALTNRVVSENISEIMDTEEIMYLKRLMNVTNTFCIESFLSDYLVTQEVPNEYKYYLIAKRETEAKNLLTIEKNIKDAATFLPKEIREFLSTFFIDAVRNDYSVIDEEICKVLNNEECVKFLDELENKLGFRNPVTKTDAVRYMKQKYSQYQDYYYIDLLTNYSGYASLGLLYVFYEE